MTQIYTSQTIERDLVQACKRRDRRAQEAVFKRFAGKMMAVCKRYLGTGPLAEDVLMEGFMKVFSKVETFNEAEDAIMHLEVEELNKLIESLPAGYKTVFNLYAIEGYTHQEIAEMLGIQEGTSKSQLSRARGLLQQKLNELQV